jgi:hypothetical protein
MTLMPTVGTKEDENSRGRHTCEGGYPISPAKNGFPTTASGMTPIGIFGAIGGYRQNFQRVDLWKQFLSVLFCA